LKTLAKWILAVEPYLLVVTLFLFWLTSERLEFLLLFIPAMVARLIVYRRLWTPTPMDIFLIALVILIFLNYRFAPYTRSLWIGSRALLGVAIVWSITDLARRRGSTNGLVMGTILLGLLVGTLGLGSSQWTEKSSLLKPITDLLPTIRNFPGSIKGFNVNEIAGAMAWLMPFAGGIAIYEWRNRRKDEGRHNPRLFYATLAFFILWLALFLGQSRIAIFGIIAALGILTFTLVPRGRWRWLSLGVVVAFTVIEVVFFVGVFSPDESLAGRDESSWGNRFNIWNSAIQIIGDHPLTGVGMNKFRLNPVRQVYPVEGYETRILPHAHNEWMQIGTDLGVPGLILFAGWHLMAMYMLVRVWREGDFYAQAVAVSLFAGLVAHGVFGLADAITLWDRFSFVFWLFIGLTTAQYVVTVRTVVATERVEASVPELSRVVTTSS
jgi:hypothetical protein